ncbi:MAG: YraN family protein [Bacteroidota bacterium]|nr:YraN family protein [Bacteroidota bacterium]
MVLERRAWTGRLGESLVVAEFEQQGHRILQRNWRWRRAEVDVISTDGTALVFHEVKCRSGHDTLTLDPMMWWPHVAQQRRLVQAAHAFVRQHPGGAGRLRFDVWLVESVAAGAASPRTSHFPDAFDPRAIQGASRRRRPYL